ncbi:MAG: hypothetical protein K1000chlam3_01019 [Chlamydiae bacterium]|nr:hypothetical protein [Chlamydiota bacterium]
MLERVKKEGRIPNDKDWLGIYQKYPETMETLKKVADFHKFIMDNRESLLRILQQPEKIKTYRQSGHYIDAKTKTAGQKQQRSFFDLLSKETKGKISQLGVEVETEGIRLTPPQDKLMKCAYAAFT